MQEREQILIGMLSGYSRCRDEIILLFNDINFVENEFAANTYNIIKYIGERGIAVSVLLQSNLLWDAQILMRPIQEATMKICFLCNCSSEEQKERFKEYLIDLKEINSLKQSKIAKNIVASGIASKCEVQLAYAIGVAQPVSIMVDTFNTGKIDEEKIEAQVREIFDTTPLGIIETLRLKRPIYTKTAAYGHFGRNEPDFTWEKIDKSGSFKM